MKKLRLLWIIALFLIAMPIVFAPPPATICSTFSENCGGNAISNTTGFFFRDDFETAGAPSANWTVSGAGNVVVGGHLRLSSSNRNTEYIRSLVTIPTNTTCDLQMNISGATTALNIGFIGLSNAAPTTDLYGALDGISNAAMVTAFSSTNKLDFMYDSATASGINTVAAANFNTVTLTDKTNLSYFVNESGGVNLYMNQTFVAGTKFGSGTNVSGFQLHFSMATGQSVGIDYLNCYPGSSAPITAAQASDTTSPIVNTSLNTTTPRIFSTINFTGNVTDETGLTSANITYNMSGVLTKVNFTLTGTSAQVSNVTRITTGRGSVINFTMYVTDTSNNVKQTSQLVTVQNTLPLSPSIVNATGQTFRTNQTINWTSSDTDGDSILFTVCFNGPCFNTFDYNFSTNMDIQGSYFLNVSAADGVGNSTNASLNISLDTSIPSWNSSFLSNGTHFRASQNITYNCTDPQLKELNTTFKRIGGSISTSLSFTGLTGQSSKEINLSINVSSGDGIYNASRSCRDSYNLPAIEDSVIIIIDTVLPRSNVTHRSTGDAFDITFPINVSFFLSDLYLFSANLSHNASGIFVNHSINVSLGNGTYHYVIGNGNFSGSQVVGYEIFGFDKAGNINSSSGNFRIDPVKSTGPGGGGGGGGGSNVQSPCTIYATDPSDGGNLNFVKDGNIMRAKIAVRNEGYSQGIYTFLVSDGAFFKEKCSFTKDQAFIDVNGDFVNTLSCDVPEMEEEGAVEVRACDKVVFYNISQKAGEEANVINPVWMWGAIAVASMFFIMALILFSIPIGKFFKSWF